MDPPLIGQVGHYSVTFRPHLGAGSFGCVYKAKHDIDSQLYAAKEIKISDEEGENQELAEMAAQEFDILMKLQRHNNILKVVEHFTRGTSFWIITDFCDQGDLKLFLSKNKDLSRLRQVDIMHQSADGLAFMHSQSPPIVHRDIKLQNLLIKSESNEDVVKICDFGFARFYDEQVESTFSAVFKQQKRMESLRGTAPFMAPEFSAELDGGLEYDASVDVFALGLVYHVILDPNKPHYYPLSVESKKANRFINIGDKMVHCHREKKTMPTVIENKPADDDCTSRLKRIIRNMTQFRSVKRKDIDDVRDELSEVLRYLRAQSIKTKQDVEEVIVTTAALTTSVLPSGSRTDSKDSLEKLCDKNWKLKNKVKLPGISIRALRAVHGQLWQCMSDNSIAIYNEKLQQQELIPTRDMNAVYDVAALPNGDVIIASVTGVYHCTREGTKKSTIAKGNCLSIASAEWTINYHISDSSVINKCTYDGTWKNNIELPCSKELMNTLAVHNSAIYVCGYVSNTTSKISLSPNDNSDQELKNTDFASPIMCQIDDNGMMLVADRHNNRLQVRETADQWHVVNVKLPLVDPCRAVVLSGKLYVSSTGEQTLFVYAPSK